MKRPIETIACCVIAATFAACADNVAAPEALEVAPGGIAPLQTVAVASSGAEQASGTGVFAGDGSSYRECLGEVVHVHNEIPFRWHRVVTPSGNVMFSDPFIPNAGVGQTEGLTSG